MPRFFADGGPISDQSEDESKREYFIITGDDAFHIARSLRMAVGESITVCDGKGKEYLCRLESITDSRVEATVIEGRSSSSEPNFFAYLFQALPKGDKLDTVIQKSVECGVCAIVPFESERCIVKVKRDAEERKTERRRKIAEEAAKQCGRGIIPRVEETVSFERMLELALRCDIKLFCYEGEENNSLKSVLESFKAAHSAGGCSVALVVGSEGGFSEKEADAAARAGLVPVGLGKRILRTETAPIFALACLVYELDM